MKDVIIPESEPMARIRRDVLQADSFGMSYGHFKALQRDVLKGNPRAEERAFYLLVKAAYKEEEQDNG